MTCPFIDAVEADDQDRIDRMTSDCAPAVKGQLVDWARALLKGDSIDDVLASVEVPSSL